MKFNWKALVALVLIVVIAFWAFDSTRSRSYNGSALTFGVGSGPIKITNPGDVSIPVQLVGTGSRSFSITSNIEGVTGSSTREGTGSSAKQLFEFALPAGISEITVLRGSGVNFVTDTDVRLEAVVAPVSASDAGNTLLVVLVIGLGLLFYASSTTGHRWIGMLRGKTEPVPVPAAETTGGQGQSAKSYGDNRA